MVVEEERNPAEEEGEKNPAEEGDDKNPTGEEDKNPADNLVGQDEIDPEAKKSCNDEKTQKPMDVEDPASKGGNAVINKEHISLSNKVVKTHVPIDEGTYLPSNIQASTVASESSFSAGGRIISYQRTRLKSDTVEGLLCLHDWLKADEPKPTNKDVDEEEYLVFYQASKCHKDGRACRRSSMPSSSLLSSPALSSSSSLSTSTTNSP